MTDDAPDDRDMIDMMDEGVAWEHCRRALEKMHELAEDPEVVYEIERMQNAYVNAQKAKYLGKGEDWEEYRDEWEEEYGGV